MRGQPDKSLRDFMGQFLVCCPRCGSKALVEDHGVNSNPQLTLICSACALAKSRTKASSVVFTKRIDSERFKNAMLVGAPVDPHFHLPLWLQVDCRKNTLWFYNAEHMVFVEGYVQAKLRERHPLDVFRNWTLTSRLPTWIKLAKNRDVVLQGIARLKERNEEKSD